MTRGICGWWGKDRCSDGTEEQIIFKPINWWWDLVRDIAVREFWYQSKVDIPRGKKSIEERLAGRAAVTGPL